jgi:hypothetical protein
MKKRTAIVVIISMLIMLILSYFPLREYFSDDEEWTEIVINEGDNSIFTGCKPSDISESLAVALNVTPLISKTQKDMACCITVYKFYYQNDTTIMIHLDEKSRSLFTIFGSPIRLSGDLDLGINISVDPMGLTEKVGNLWKKFLNGFNIDLMDDDYDISISSLNENMWKVYVRQTCNEIYPLKNTGMTLTIGDNSEISLLKIDEWANIDINREFLIDDNKAKNIIDNEIPELNINKTELNFTGFTYFGDDVYFHFKYEYEFDNDSVYQPGIQIMTYDGNGTPVEVAQTNKTFSFYINVDSGEFVCNDSGIRKLRKNN